MTTQLTDIQIEKMQEAYQDYRETSDWVAIHQVRDQKRQVARKEMLILFADFQEGKVSFEEFRGTFDQKSRTDWDVFGFKGMSGAGFLNLLVKHIPNQEELAQELRRVFKLPGSEAEVREKLYHFQDYLEGIIRDGKVSRRFIQPGRIPFLVSGVWHLQEMENWPVYYISGRRVLERESLYETQKDPVEDYFSFRDCFLYLASALKISSWELEHFLAWQDENRQASAQGTPLRRVITQAPVIQEIYVEDKGVEEVEGDLLSHNYVQGLLAKIGRKLDCRVWIASNDHGKSWSEGRLGDLSIDTLPQLGLDPETQRIISLIDVLWIKGYNQVVCAFEIEHTTSVYSGLLRMSDLVASAPNLNFQLYIVTPQTRLDQVRRQLARPTFQMLELHKQCGFFSFETLIRESENIIRWASDTAIIEQLAEKVDDVVIGY